MSHPLELTAAIVVIAAAAGFGALVTPRPKPEPPPEEKPRAVLCEVGKTCPALVISKQPETQRAAAQRKVDEIVRRVEDTKDDVAEIKAAIKKQRDEGKP